jgi:hypothetical protein
MIKELSTHITQVNILAANYEDECPGYDSTGQITPTKVRVKAWEVYIPLNPKISTIQNNVGIKANGVTNNYPPLGIIGIATNGVPIFGNADGS